MSEVKAESSVIVVTSTLDWSNASRLWKNTWLKQQKHLVHLIFYTSCVDADAGSLFADGSRTSTAKDVAI
jgi:hypothetical protein